MKSDENWAKLTAQPSDNSKCAKNLTSKKFLLAGRFHEGRLYEVDHDFLGHLAILKITGNHDVFLTNYLTNYSALI